MAKATIRLLLINKQLSFTVRMKQALEEIGGYVVSPFTAADTALDHLKSNPHDIAVVDFTLPGVSGDEVVRQLRRIQPDLLIIASPELPEVEAKVADLQLSGIVDAPCSAREMIPALQDALAKANDVLPETTEAPIITNESETQAIDPMMTEHTPRFSSLDSIIIKTGGLDPAPGTGTLEVDMGGAEGGDLPAQEDDEQPSQSIEVILSGELAGLKNAGKESNESFDHEAMEVIEDDEDEDTPVDEVFQQLAAEEPPIPTLEENGTVSDLMNGISAAGFDEVASAVVREQASVERPVSEDMTLEDDEDDDTPAEMILKTALDDDAAFPISLEELLANIEQQFPENVEGIKPLPSWVSQLEQYVREPDFLGENLPELDDVDNSSYQTTRMVDFEAEPALHEMDTDKIQPVQKPSVELPPYEFKDEDDEDIDALVGDALEELEADTATFNVSELSEHQSDFDEYATDPVGAFEPKPFAKSSQESEGTQQTLGLESADPEIAQLALTLTQVSLELTAEATLLAREGEIVAFSGTMPFEDVQDLGDVIGHDWGAKVGEARIRFVTLPGSGKDYMLYSRMADGGFALSMIFAGNMPLRVIRRQSDRLINALGAVPEPEAPEPLESSLIDELQIMEELRQLEERAASEEEAAIESSQQLILEYPELGEIEEDEDEYVDDEILEAEFYEEAEDEIAEDEEEAEPEFTPAEAVQPVVERQVAPVKIPQMPTKPLVSYTYIWMIRDANKPLGKEVAEAIVTELDKQLTEIGWRCNILHVFEDYVYLVADVPADTLSHEILPELKRRSAQIAYGVDNSVTTDNLWADSYLVLTPGRELHISEIQRFINFSGAG